MNIVAKYLNLGQLSVKHWNLTWNQKRTSHMLAPPKTSMPINKPLAAAAYTRGDMSTASVSATAKPSGPATTSHQTAFSTFFFFSYSHGKGRSAVGFAHCKSTPLIHFKAGHPHSLQGNDSRFQKCKNIQLWNGQDNLSCSVCTRTRSLHKGELFVTD